MPTSCLTDSIIVSWLAASCLDLQVRPNVEFHCLLQHAGAIKDVFTMKEVWRDPATHFILFHLPSCNCDALPAGDVLPGPVHHPEAAVRSEAAAHCPLLPRRTGPGAGSRQLLRQRAAVRRRFHLSDQVPTSRSQQHTVFVSEFCLRWSWRTSWLWRTQVRTSYSLCIPQKSRLHLRPIIHNPVPTGESALKGGCFFFFFCSCFPHRNNSFCLFQIRAQATRIQMTRERSQRWKKTQWWRLKFNNYWSSWMLNLWLQEAAGCSSPDRRSRRRRRRRSCRSSDPGELLLLIAIKRSGAVA